MEWVETTGRTVEEAKDAALDELGVDLSDAEFEVLSEPRAGLLGLLRSEARVRARVRPAVPRSKDERRDRRRSAGSTTRSRPRDELRAHAGADGQESAEPAGAGARRRRSPAAGSGSSAEDRVSASSTEGAGARPPASTRRTATGDGVKPEGGARETRGREPTVEVPIDEQGRIASGFVRELLTEFGVSATITPVRHDDDTLELQLSGQGLGLLIGPKGSTLLAIQSLARTVVFHETGASNGHINLDVGGYRQKRTEALTRFAHQIAERVAETGARTALEPMSAADRKVVHDTISGIEGVSTVSEGEEPMRRVVVLPAPEAPAG